MTQQERLINVCKLLELADFASPQVARIARKVARAQIERYKSLKVGVTL
ncbi:hypothetical protein PV433_26055 [Paenibacillus sp. GYB004]